MSCIQPRQEDHTHARVHKRQSLVRLLLATGVDVEARKARHETGLHHVKTPVMRGLILEHNANMLAVCKNGMELFDISNFSQDDRDDCISDAAASLLEIYGIGMKVAVLFIPSSVPPNAHV